MYTEIGSFHAKARLSELLRGIKRGKRYTITLRGRPVADLVPSQGVGQEDAHIAIQAMQNIGKVRGISAEKLADWIEEGRR